MIEGLSRGYKGIQPLHYLRSVAFCVAVLLLTMVVAPTVPVLLVFNAHSWTLRWIVKIWTGAVMFCLKFIVGLDYRQVGRDNVPDGPCIIACNHQSLWETVAFCHLFPDASIVAKKELGGVPIIGWFLLRYPMILVDRMGGRQTLKQMVAEARSAFGEDRKVVVFPQGTRQGIDDPLIFQSAGISALYTFLDAPVVPAACNSGLFWGKKTFMIHNGSITLSFLPPIAPGLARQEFQETMERMISDEAARLIGEAEAKVSR